MPWSKNDYPPSMKNLDERIRNKAVEIANALLRDGYEEGRAIAIATSQAEEWAENHPSRDEGAKNKKSGRLSPPVSSSKKHENIHVVPHEEGWAVKEEGKDEPVFTFDNKKEAVNKAKELSDEQDIRAIIHNENGRIESSQHYDGLNK